MQTITMRDILESVDNGKLAQTFNGCKYEYENGTRCVIGCAMTDETLLALKDADENASAIEDLVDGGFVDVPELEQYDVYALQSIFDGCATYQFKEKIASLREKYGVDKKGES